MPPRASSAVPPLHLGQLSEKSSGLHRRGREGGREGQHAEGTDTPDGSHCHLHRFLPTSPRSRRPPQKRPGPKEEQEQTKALPSREAESEGKRTTGGWGVALVFSCSKIFRSSELGGDSQCFPGSGNLPTTKRNLNFHPQIQSPRCGDSERILLFLLSRFWCPPFAASFFFSHFGACRSLAFLTLFAPLFLIGE